MNKLLTVIRYEYLTMVKSRAFWFSVIGMPLFFGIFAAIGFFSTPDDTDLEDTEINEETLIEFIDEGNYIPEEFSQGNISEIEASEREGAIDKVKTEEIDLFIVYPESIRFEGQEDGNQIEVYSADSGIFSSANGSNVAITLLRQSYIQGIQDQSTALALSQQPSVNLNSVSENAEESFEFTDFVVPGLSFVFFFIMIFTSGQFLLQGVAEEKENRMIETILSMIPSRTLIWGKIFSILLTGITQLALWLGLGLLVYLGLTNTIIDPIDIPLDSLELNPIEVLWSMTIALLGLITYSGFMAGVGALGRNYKESSQVASVFIILAVLPMSFLTAILANPDASYIIAASYVPITSPFLLLIRTAFGLPLWEYVLGLLVNITYLGLSLWLSVRLFNIGALETTKALNVKDAFQRLFQRK